ncbi:unnamed protein product [Pedinophyceae sp. YPF-701]|nr:unnamed protein product [Pedinophyceae sp. YPF-701]
MPCRPLTHGAPLPPRCAAQAHGRPRWPPRRPASSRALVRAAPDGDDAAARVADPAPADDASAGTPPPDIDSDEFFGEKGAREKEKKPEYLDLGDPVGLVRAAALPAAPEVEAVISAGTEGLDADRVLGMFPFQLDDFQIASLQALLEGKSVVVCAPTGAGKTAIAESAAAAFLARGKRVVYTTPLKALSNQKLYELRQRFGSARLGLQTGDASLNTDADITVMTTEILRNIMYRVQHGGDAAEAADGAGDAGGESAEEDPPPDRLDVLTEDEDAMDAAVVAPGSPEGGGGSTRLHDVGLVVLDEVHYLSDPHRGGTWEEVVINCPPGVSILALSATVENPEDLAGWIRQVHGPCDTVITKLRPVPLMWHFCLDPTGAGEDNAELFPLLNPSGRQLAWDLQVALGMAEDVELEAKKGRRGRDGSWEDWADPGEWKQAARKKFGARDRMRTMIPSMPGALEALRREDMLPAIWFIFSRRGCDQAVERAGRACKAFTTPEEREQIAAELEALRAEQPEAVREALEDALLAGIASHHAGCLPAWKSLVESLFQQGLLKVVFATDTLAAGINMPARTTVIDALSRRRGEGHVTLTHNELLQMAGRAGRRGFDTLGHCVILQGRFEGAEDAADIIIRGPEPLQSRFAAGYGMVLNVLATRTLEEAKAFVERSFGAYMGGDAIRERLAEIEGMEERAAAMIEEVEGKHGERAGAQDAAAAAAELRKSKVRLREERATLRNLRRQAAEDRGERIAALLTSGQEGQLPRAAAINLSALEGNGMDILDDDAPLLRAVVVGVAGPELAIVPPADTGAGQQAALARAMMAADAASRAGRGLASEDSDDDDEDDSEGSYDDDDDDDDDDFEDASEDEAVSWLRWPRRLVCVAADGFCYIVNPDSVVGLGPVLPPGDVLDAAREAALALPQAEWRSIGGPLSGAGYAEAPGAVNDAEAAIRAATTGQIDYVAIDEDMEMAVRFQGRIVDEIRERVRSARAAKSKNTLPRKATKKLARAGKLMRRAERLRKQLEARTAHGWRAFEDVVGVLQDAGALEAEESPGGHLAARPLGDVARQVRCENELWMAMALTHPATQLLSPRAFAGLVGALVTPGVVGSRPGVSCGYRPSRTVLDAIESMVDAADKLDELQAARRNLDSPVDIDVRLSGLCEAWAGGVSWDQLTEDTALDDGDVARLLSRVCDLLRQVVRCDALTDELRGTARAALRAMVRQPISEL